MPPAFPPAFRIKEVGHHYRRAAHPSLVGISAEIPAGQTVAVLGPSGSGKSTLLSLMGLLWDGPGSEGHLWYHDGFREYNLLDRVGPNKLRAAEKAALRASSFGFVLQSSYMLPHFKCLENVGMPLAMQGWPAAERSLWASGLMDSFREWSEGEPAVEDHLADGEAAVGDDEDDLDEKRNEPPRQASFGQRQRFAVLRALVADPTVVFADEPSSSLDPGRATRLFALLHRWKSGELFRDVRGRFPVSKRTPEVVRDWIERKGGDRTPRTLVLVCHDVAIARREADRFLLVGQDHTLRADFPRHEWDQNAETVEDVLKLLRGEAGRDRS